MLTDVNYHTYNLWSMLWLIGHFRVPKGLCIKTRLGAQPLIWKWFFILMQIKLISTRKVEHLTSFWYRGPGELGNSLSTVSKKVIRWPLSRDCIAGSGVKPKEVTSFFTVLHWPVTGKQLIAGSGPLFGGIHFASWLLWKMILLKKDISI